MLSEDKIIGIFCLIEDIMKGINHPEDVRRRVSDSEVLTTAIVSAMYFGGHYEHAIGFMRTARFIPQMLSSSRFNRRVQRLGNLLIDLFIQVSNYLKEVCGESEYILDSFPVAVCDNIRIMRSKLLSGNKWRGYTASMRRYFYGIKVQLLVTRSGIPIHFCFVPGKQADAKALERILEKLPPESRIYADSAYTNYQVEDTLFEKEFVKLKTQRKSNSKRPDTHTVVLEKLSMRKRVETSISDIKKMFPRTIHPVTLNRFLLKLILFIFALQLTQITN